MIRWFIIFIETLIIVAFIADNKQINQIFQRILNAIPSSSEIKTHILEGFKVGTGIATIIFGLFLLYLLIRYIVPYVKILLNKKTLIENWWNELEKEFIKEKTKEVKKINQMKEQVSYELQEAKRKNQELQSQIRTYQELKYELEQERENLRREFQKKRKRYLQELSGLQRKNKELQIRIKRLKEQLQNCRGKLKANYS